MQQKTQKHQQTGTIFDSCYILLTLLLVLNKNMFSIKAGQISPHHQKYVMLNVVYLVTTLQKYFWGLNI